MSTLSYIHHLFNIDQCHGIVKLLTTVPEP
jgi:hypothetical protein